MKSMKKIITLIMALALILSLSVTAFADEDTTVGSSETTKGSITIDNAIPGQTYTLYKVLNLESYDSEAGNYAYTGTSEWAEFITGSQVFTYTGSYISGETYVTWSGKYTAAQVADMMLTHIENMATPIPYTDSVTADSTTVTFDNLDLGYYLVVSSAGYTCSLDTTNNNVVMREKNEVPTVTKEVKEGETWGETNDASIGDVIDFQTTITVPVGAKNLVLHDKMDSTLALKTSDDYEAAFTITFEDGTAVDSSYWGLNVSCADGCTFEIDFEDALFSDFAVNTKIIVAYQATLTKDAIIGEVGNVNDTWGTYGDNETETTHDSTVTYTYEFDLVKTKSDNTVLDGAKFQLTDSEGTEIALVKDTDGAYRPVVSGRETAVEIEAGFVTIKGLDAGTYYLVETQAPNGYNKVKDPIEVVISAEAELEAEVTDNDDGTYTYVDGGIQVINYTGSEMPSIGGMGTTLFYVVGGMLVLAAVVLLVTKKRMNAQA